MIERDRPIRKSKDHLANSHAKEEIAFPKKHNYASRKFVVEIFACKIECIYFQNDRIRFNFFHRHLPFLLSLYFFAGKKKRNNATIWHLKFMVNRTIWIAWCLYTIWNRGNFIFNTLTLENVLFSYFFFPVSLCFPFRYRFCMW